MSERPRPPIQPMKVKTAVLRTGDACVSAESGADLEWLEPRLIESKTILTRAGVPNPEELKRPVDPEQGI